VNSNTWLTVACVARVPAKECFRIRAARKMRLSPHFSRCPNAKTSPPSFARPEFRSRRSGTLATLARLTEGKEQNREKIGGSKAVRGTEK